MAGPPENVTPSALFAALVQTPRPHRVIDFPRIDPRTKEPVGKLALWVLTQQEHMACAADADRTAKRLSKEQQNKGEANLGYESIYSNEGAVQLIFRAARAHDDVTKPAFPTADDVRKHLTADEVATLLSAYFQMTAETGPILNVLTKDDLDAWTTRLEAGGLESAPFYLLSSEAKNDLISHLVGLCSSLRTANSSPGLQPVVGYSEATPEVVIIEPV